MIIRDPFWRTLELSTRFAERKNEFSLVPEPSRGRFGHLKRIYKKPWTKDRGDDNVWHDLTGFACHSHLHCAALPGSEWHSGSRQLAAQQGRLLSAGETAGLNIVWHSVADPSEKSSDEALFEQFNYKICFYCRFFFCTACRIYWVLVALAEENLAVETLWGTNKRWDLCILDMVKNLCISC